MAWHSGLKAFASAAAEGPMITPEMTRVSGTDDQEGSASFLKALGSLQRGRAVSSSINEEGALIHFDSPFVRLFGGRLFSGGCCEHLVSSLILAQLQKGATVSPLTARSSQKWIKKTTVLLDHGYILEGMTHHHRLTVCHCLVLSLAGGGDLPVCDA